MIRVDISPGELLDKLSILEIKKERLEDEAKLINVEREFVLLNAAKGDAIAWNKDLEELYVRLKKINEDLWEIEDSIRCCERRKEFGCEFIDLARSVYMKNDSRSQIKREINNRLRSKIVEEKGYAAY